MNLLARDLSGEVLGDLSAVQEALGQEDPPVRTCECEQHRLKQWAKQQRNGLPRRRD